MINAMVVTTNDKDDHVPSQLSLRRSTLQIQLRNNYKGRRCNCSICSRKGIVNSFSYIPPENIERVEGMSSLALYQFGDKDVNHYFCRTCGVCPFTTVASVPPDYVGPARPGYYRINLGCIENIDVYGLEIEVIDGRSL